MGQVKRRAACWPSRRRRRRRSGSSNNKSMVNRANRWRRRPSREPASRKATQFGSSSEPDGRPTSERLLEATISSGRRWRPRFAEGARSVLAAAILLLLLILQSLSLRQPVGRPSSRSNRSSSSARAAGWPAGAKLSHQFGSCARRRTARGGRSRRQTRTGREAVRGDARARKQAHTHKGHASGGGGCKADGRRASERASGRRKRGSSLFGHHRLLQPLASFAFAFPSGFPL